MRYNQTLNMIHIMINAPHALLQSWVQHIYQKNLITLNTRRNFHNILISIPTKRTKNTRTITYIKDSFTKKSLLSHKNIYKHKYK